MVGTFAVNSLSPVLLSAALELDRRCLGGLWSADGYQREIDSPNSDLLVLQDSIALSPLLALGCSWAIVDEAHITLLAVNPDFQRQGLGQALLYLLLKASQQRRLERATLEVRATNATALALYQKFGFQEAGRRKGYYQDNGEDALVLWRGGLQYPQFVDEVASWRQWVSDRLIQSGWQLSPSWDVIPPQHSATNSIRHIA